MTLVSGVVSSAARPAAVDPLAGLLFVVDFDFGAWELDFGAWEKVDSPKIFSRSCMRGALEVVDLAQLPDVVAGAEMLGLSERVELPERLGCRTVVLVGFVLDGNPARRGLPPCGDEAVRFPAWLDTAGFELVLAMLPARDVFECLDVRLELGCP